ncbi:MAG: glycoside hydrolase family 25 protein [Bacilli bacterium]
MKKNIFILIIILMTIIGGIFFYKYHKKNDGSKEEIEAVIKVQTIEDLTIEFNSKVKVSELIASINGNIIDDSFIDTTKLGKNKVKFSYINDDNIRVNYSFDINVVDTVPPLIWNAKTYTIYKGNNFDYSNVLCGDNYDSNPTCVVEGEYDVNKLGIYPLTFKGTDSSGNVTTEEFVLKVINPPISSTPKPPVEESRTSFKYVVDNYKTKDTKIGIDISEWQGSIDFNKLKEAGVEFIILRVGGNKKTEGDNFVDKKFVENIQKANEVGIDVGLYFFSYANSKEHAIRDAKWLLKQIEGYEVNLPIAFDWENWAYYNWYELSFFELTEMAESFIEVIEEAGYKGMLYSSKTYLEYIWLETDYPIWLAHYTTKTNYEGEYLFWQLCSNGLVPGINGPVDINIMYVNDNKTNEKDE